MKHKQVIKQLLKSIAISMAIVLVFGLIYWFVLDYRADIEQEIQTKNGDLIAKKTLYSSTDKRVNDVNEAYKYYVEFSRSRDSQPNNFRRENANKILASIGEELAINQLLLAMGQFKELDAPFKREYVSLYNSDVTIQFIAFEDLALYNLLRKIEDSFPGNVIIDKFSFRREKYTEPMLIDLSEGQRAGLVSGDISFRWRGIQENAKLPLPVTKQPPQGNPNPVQNQGAKNE